MRRLKAREKQRCFGRFWGCIISAVASSLICSTNERLSLANSTIFCLEKNLWMASWLQNGANKALKTFAVCSAYRNRIVSLGPAVYAGCQKMSSTTARISSARAVAAVGAPVAIEKKEKTKTLSVCKFCYFKNSFKLRWIWLFCSLMSPCIHGERKLLFIWLSRRQILVNQTYLTASWPLNRYLLIWWKKVCSRRWFGDSF